MIPSFMTNFSVVSYRLLFDLHSTHDVGGLSLNTIADVLHVDDGTQQVHVVAQLIKVALTEQFDVWGQEILWKIITQEHD